MAKKRKTVSQAAMEEKQAAVEKKREDKSERISPREAARAAAQYYNELTGAGEQGSIEEIELNQAGNRWIVTLSFIDRTLMLMGPKIYKLFEVNAYTGDVLTMKIRKV
ncbi:MAG: hypothetical protein JSU86_12405 [Phycisphaerales bacterium]|nr:MAG: hypothetical protein JSU86_12405 [Phycisphaerales bacterium]